ncbi:hypothetical protein [Mesorhizobium sp. L2C084A000]|uniref:hypothetical protein n=1 Tax=Mesorhizobium sp. L2C084A000 TaxID=1287116 RepID=UPI000410FE3F|nr:hypothetical protein [Mesorhizobium sp. L2C084A000]
MWLILRVRQEAPDAELCALAYGSQLYKHVAAKDVPLLQSVYDAWAAWFTSDDVCSENKLQAAFDQVVVISRSKAKAS